MTLSSLLADCYRRLGFATTPASEISTRMTAFVNETQRDILSEPGMERLLVSTTTFASVADIPQYSLAPSISRIVKIYEATNRLALTQLSQDLYRTIQPDPTITTATPSAFVDLGMQFIAQKPSNASELFVDSTAAGDTNTVYLEGYRTGGYFVSLSTTMTGITGKSMSAAYTDIIDVTKFYLSAAAVGTVTLIEDSELGTVLATIPIGQTYARYPHRIALWPTPSAAITYSVDFERDISDMANANDEPVLPVRFHRLLAIGARMKEYDKREDPRYVSAKREYDEVLGQLKYFLFAGPNVRPVMGRTVVQRPSQLGGWFPAGS